MTYQQARIWIVKYSLSASVITFIFFAIAPAVGYPLDFEQAIRILEITTPVFLGYLGAAAQFLVKAGEKKTAADPEPHVSELLQLLVKGPIFAFLAAAVAVVVAFYLSNGARAEFGKGMSVDTLSLFMSGALGMLTVTTNVVVAYLFQAPIPATEPKGNENQA